MANYESLARSNYVRLRDVEAFRNLCTLCSYTIAERNDTRTGETLYAFLAEAGYAHTVDREMLDDDTAEASSATANGDTEEEVDVLQAFAQTLALGEVLVVYVIGWEKLCYLTGEAFAINSEGKEIGVSLGDIMKQAKTLANPEHQLTLPEY